ncbi:MAG: glycosyltransferase family 25 protein [Flavobacteriaceae bacterium]|nr:glycosyltransferase family 25 protein [Flavobacteriaceae bacterium]
MIDILIKSFNRPYYLDRCLKSIETFVVGNYKISILDDGTPAKYLDKIQEKHPLVRILKSKNHEKKIKAIEENLTIGKEINGFQIPTDLWKNAVKNASDYFIITEDDVWFSEKINIDDLAKKAQKHKISLLKLGWLSNFKDDQWVNLIPIDNELTATQPKDLFLSIPLIMDWFFYNKYKFFSLGYKLKIFDNQTKLKYWALNSILMGFWQKDYWLSVWKDAQGKVDEKQQLRNAANYYKKHQHPYFIARLNQEVMKTTFQSSATNSYHEYGFDFDVNIFNHLINEAWYNEDFNAMQNFPKDFSLNYFEQFISEKIKIEEYKKWVERFKNQYINLGCNIE